MKQKQLQSFDIFDTLLVRSWARPSDLFWESGALTISRLSLDMKPEAWRILRRSVEHNLRRYAPGGEILLDQIYQELARRLHWSSDERNIAMTIEIDTERKGLTTLPTGVEKLRTARCHGFRIAFLSDMYLPSSLLKTWLTQFGLWESEDLLLVSGEEGCSKRDGGLFGLLSNRTGVPPEQIVHHGDNLKADVQVPKRLGFSIDPMLTGHLSRYEKAMSDLETPFTSRLAAAARLARLDALAEGKAHQSVIRTVSSGVAGPLLLGYVHWLLREAERLGIRRLYFVSRDGQILLRLAEQLMPRLDLNLDLRYLYGSRLAWMLPGWSAGISSEHVEAEQAGTETTESKRDERTDKARAYLQQEGLLDEVPWAMVDLGWRGRLQLALGALLNPMRPGPVTGFYLALSPDHLRRNGDRLLTFFSGRLPNLWTAWPTYGTVLELFAAADHGQVTGYHAHEDWVEPTLRNPKNDTALDWGLEEQQNAIMTFTRFCLSLMNPRGWQASDWREAIVSSTCLFLQNPTKDEAEIYGNFTVHPDLSEDRGQSLAPKGSVHRLILALLRSGSALAHVPWAEATIVRTLPWPEIWQYWIRERRHLRYRIATLFRRNKP